MILTVGNSLEIASAEPSVDAEYPRPPLRGEDRTARTRTEWPGAPVPFCSRSGWRCGLRRRRSWLGLVEMTCVTGSASGLPGTDPAVRFTLTVPIEARARCGSTRAVSALRTVKSANRLAPVLDEAVKDQKSHHQARAVQVSADRSKIVQAKGRKSPPGHARLSSSISFTSFSVRRIMKPIRKR